jgi:hypothetical protein
MMEAKALMPIQRYNQASEAACPQCQMVRLPQRLPQGQVIQELSGRRVSRLKVPCLIKPCMMALLNNARIQIQVDNVLIGCHVPEKDTSEVVVVQFGPPIPKTLDTDPRPRSLEVFKIRFHFLVIFKRSA